MAIEAVKIPQNVYVEDRIVGPLTLRQVIIVTLGGGGSYAMWSSLVNTYGQLDIITTAIVWTPAVLAFAFAFIRVNDLSLTRLLLLSLEKMRKPAVRSFGPRTGISITIRTFQTEQAKQTAAHASAATVITKEQRLTELSSVLDSPLDETNPAPAPEPVAEPAESQTTRPPVEASRIQISDVPKNAPTVDGVTVRSSLYGSRTPANA